MFLIIFRQEQTAVPKTDTAVCVKVEPVETTIKRTVILSEAKNLHAQIFRCRAT